MSPRHMAPQSNEQSAPTVNPARKAQSGMNKKDPSPLVQMDKECND